jgi:chromosome segregation ATPase
VAPTKATIWQRLSSARAQRDRTSASLAALKQRRESIETLIAEIEACREEFNRQVEVAVLKMADLSTLEAQVQVVKGYRGVMGEAVIGWQRTRALNNIDAVLSQAKQHLIRINSQIDQKQNSLFYVQIKINNLDYQYRRI